MKETKKKIITLDSEFKGLFLKFSSVFLSFFFSSYVSKNFNLYDVGLIFQVQLFVILGVQFSLLGYDLFILEKIPFLQKKRCNVVSYLNKIFFKLIAPTLFIFLIFIFFIFNKEGNFFLILLVTLFLYLKFKINISALIALDKINISRFLENVLRPIFYILSLLMYSYFLNTNDTNIISSFMTAILFIFILSEYILRRSQYKISGSNHKIYIKFFDKNMKYFGFIFFSGIMAQFSYIYLSFIGKPDWLAVFTVNYQIALLVSFFQVTTVDFVNKKLSQFLFKNKISQDNVVYLNKLKFFNIIYTFFSSIVLLFLYEYIIETFFTSNYEDLPLFFLMICIQIFSSFFSNALSILAFTENQNLLTKIFIISLAIQFLLILSIIDISLYSYTSIFLCGIVISRLLSWFFVKRKFSYDSSVFSLFKFNFFDLRK